MYSVKAKKMEQLGGIFKGTDLGAAGKVKDEVGEGHRLKRKRKRKKIDAPEEEMV